MDVSSPSSVAPSRKRDLDAMAERTDDAPTFQVRFSDATSLRSIVDAVKSVTNNIMMVFKERDDGYVMMVDAHDAGWACYVSARVKLDAEDVVVHPSYRGEDHRVCVDSGTLRDCLDNPSCVHGVYVLEVYTHSKNTMVVRMQDPDVRGQEDRAELNLMHDEDPEVLTNMKFNMVMEIDVTKLREIIKKAQKLHADKLSIKVHLSEAGGKERSRINFAVQGNCRYEQTFCNEGVGTSEDGSKTYRAAADGDEDLFEASGPPKMEGTYPVERLAAFVKILQCRMIEARVGNMKPLMLSTRLGGGNDDASHIRCLISPSTDE